MTDVRTEEDGRRDEDFRSVGDYLTSSLLVVFTLAVGVVCATILASTLTQTRMSGIIVNGVNINIWKLNEIRARWSDIRNQIKEMTDELAGYEKRRRVLAADRLTIEAEFGAKRSQLQVVLSEFSLRMKAIPDAPWARPNSDDPATLYWSIQANREAILKGRDELRPMLGSLDKAYGDYAPARTRRNEIRELTDSLVPEIKVFQDAIAGTRTSLDALFEQISIKIDEGTRYKVENVLYELNSGWLSQFLNPLITLQPDILTLTLVIMMGVLGSSLQITYAFFKRHRSERIGVYFLRVSVGAITALVIFIVAKAGVPIIADASRLGGDAPINPYFVSFLAIISGLMSERAIVSVQAQAGRFFGPDLGSDTQRWARRDLHADFTAAQRKPEELRKLLDADAEMFDAWMRGERAVSAETQRMIAATLGTSIRELFTDIAPDMPSPAKEERSRDAQPARD